MGPSENFDPEKLQENWGILVGNALTLDVAHGYLSVTPTWASFLKLPEEPKDNDSLGLY